MDLGNTHGLDSMHCILLSKSIRMVPQHHQIHLCMYLEYNMLLVGCIGFEHTCGGCTVAAYK